MTRDELTKRVRQTLVGIITTDELRGMCSAEEWAWVMATYPTLIDDCKPTE